VPYVLYVYGGDLLRERRKMAAGAPGRALKRWTARRIFGAAAGIIAISDWSADLVRRVMDDAGVRHQPPVLVNPLGTDPSFFHPGRDARLVRARFGLGDAPVLLTVARLVPHKGIDVAIRALAMLAPQHPTLRYLVVGTGEDAARLEALARDLGVGGRVVFAGTLSDAEIAEAHAMATVYVGLSRVDAEINAEGFGIAFVEAGASGTPCVAGDSGGVRSAVRDGETGIVVDPIDVGVVARAISELLENPDRRRAMGVTARQAAEAYYNWTRVADDVRAFVGRVARRADHGGGAAMSGSARPE
jgi:glycosyltransferase involved in cell wall biosynthesis